MAILKLKDEIELYEKEIKDRSERLFIDEAVLKHIKELLSISKARLIKNEVMAKRMAEGVDGIVVAKDHLRL